MKAFFRIHFIVTFLLSLLVSVHSRAQSDMWETNTTKKKEHNAKSKFRNYKDHVLKWGLDTGYNRAFLIGGKLNSDGWSGCMYFVKRKNTVTNNYWQVNLSEIKHEKQTKQKGTSAYPQLGNGTPYVYGKINNLYTLQVGYGKEKQLLPAVMEDNLSLGFRYNFGLSLAMLKPYYLKLVYDNNYPDSMQAEPRKYTQNDSALFLNKSKILGEAGWSKGLDETKFVTGIYFETAFTITPGKNRIIVQVISLGVNGALYSKPLPIMVDQKAYAWGISVFAGLTIGKRWKKNP